MVFREMSKMSTTLAMDCNAELPVIN